MVERFHGMRGLVDPGAVHKEFFYFNKYATVANAWAYSIVVARVIRIDETAVRFCLGPQNQKLPGADYDFVEAGARRREAGSRAFSAEKDL